MWQHYVNGLLGLWLVISAYMLSVTSLQTDAAISGVVVLILSIWGVIAMNTKKMDDVEMGSDRHMHTPSHA